MTPIAKHNLITAIIPTIAVILLLSSAQYAAVGITTAFEWSSINPLELINGFVFLLAFGFGISVFISWAVVLTVIMGVWFLLYYFIRKIYK